MDEEIIKRYRQLLKTGFVHAGEIESPSVFIDAVSSGAEICGAGDYLHLYMKINYDKIETMNYLCICEPVTNVAVEILCGMVKDKRLEQVKTITADAVAKEAGSKEKEFIEKTEKIIELMNKGIDEYVERTEQKRSTDDITTNHVNNKT